MLSNISEQCMLMRLLSLSVRFSISLPHSVESTGSTGSRKCYVIFLNSVLESTGSGSTGSIKCYVIFLNSVRC